jgi:hypothetical protein
MLLLNLVELEINGNYLSTILNLDWTRPWHIVIARSYNPGEMDA